MLPSEWLVVGDSEAEAGRHGRTEGRKDEADKMVMGCRMEEEKMMMRITRLIPLSSSSQLTTRASRRRFPIKNSEPPCSQLPTACFHFKQSRFQSIIFITKSFEEPIRREEKVPEMHMAGGDFLPFQFHFNFILRLHDCNTNIRRWTGIKMKMGNASMEVSILLFSNNEQTEEEDVS